MSDDQTNERSDGEVPSGDSLVLKGMGWGAFGGAAFGAGLYLLAFADDWFRPVRGLGTTGTLPGEPDEMVFAFLHAVLFGGVLGALAGMILGGLVGLVATGLVTVLRPLLAPGLVVAVASPVSLAVVPLVLGTLSGWPDRAPAVALGVPTAIAVVPLVRAMRVAVGLDRGTRPRVGWWGRRVPWWVMEAGGGLVGGGFGAVFGGVLGASLARQEPPYPLFDLSADRSELLIAGLMYGAVLGGMVGTLMGVLATAVLLAVVEGLRPAASRRSVGAAAVAAACAVLALVQMALWWEHLDSWWVWAPVGIAAAPMTLAVAGMLHGDTVAT